MSVPDIFMMQLVDKDLLKVIKCMKLQLGELHI